MVTVAAVAAVDDVLASVTDPEPFLDGPARARLDRFVVPAASASFLAARVLAHRLLHDSGATGARVAQRCPTCGGDDHGRPTVVLPAGTLGWYVSWSRRPSWVAAAVSTAPVGIDVEARDAALPGHLRTDGPGLHDLLRWTTAEALTKVTGPDLEASLDRVSPRPPAPAGTPDAAPDGWLLTDRIDDDWVATVASRDAVAWTGTVPGKDPSLP